MASSIKRLCSPFQEKDVFKACSQNKELILKITMVAGVLIALASAAYFGATTMGMGTTSGLSWASLGGFAAGIILSVAAAIKYRRSIQPVPEQNNSTTSISSNSVENVEDSKQTDLTNSTISNLFESGRFDSGDIKALKVSDLIDKNGEFIEERFTNQKQEKTIQKLARFREKVTKLDQEIQFIQRFVEASPDLTVRDVSELHGTKLSRLRGREERLAKFKANYMLNSELMQLTPESLTPNIDYFDEYYKNRLIALAEEKVEPLNEEQISRDNVRQLPIVNMCRLSADKLNQLEQTLPVFVLELIPNSVLNAINVTLFSYEQLHQVFKNRDRVRGNLTILNAINLYLLKIKNSANRQIEQQFLDYLTDEQIKKLDFTTFDKELFCTIFSSATAYRNNLLSEISQNQLALVIPLVIAAIKDEISLTELNGKKIEAKEFSIPAHWNARVEAIFKNPHSPELHKELHILGYQKPKDKTPSNNNETPSLLEPPALDTPPMLDASKVLIK